jgi:hypothetical protein
MEPGDHDAQSAPARPHVCGVCGKGFAFSSGLSKHRKKCVPVADAAILDDFATAAAAPPSPRLPLEPELAADTDTRKQALLQAIDGMIKACPGAGLVRRCTLESAYPAVERAVQAAMAGYANTQVFFRVLLTGCRGVESLTQVPTIKARVDLAGFAEAVGQDPSVQDNLRQVLAQYPDVVALLTPEAKLGISLLTCALSVAAANAQKKHAGGGGASGTGETN